MIRFETQIEGARPLAEAFRRYPTKMPRVVVSNFMVLGQRLAALMRRELQPVRYTGETAATVSSEIDASALTLAVGPTAPQALYVRLGTRPHWAPIAPLKAWAAWKLGDEGAAWAIQRAIAQNGTNRFYAQKGLPGAEQTQYGIGLDFPRTTLERADTQTAITNTARRLGDDLAVAIAETHG